MLLGLFSSAETALARVLPFLMYVVGGIGQSFLCSDSILESLFCLVWAMRSTGGCSCRVEGMLIFAGLFLKASILVSRISASEVRGVVVTRNDLCGDCCPPAGRGPFWAAIFSFLCFSIRPEMVDQTALTMIMMVMIFPITTGYQLFDLELHYGVTRCRFPASSVAQARSTPKTSPREPNVSTAELWPASTNSPRFNTNAVSASSIASATL